MAAPPLQGNTGITSITGITMHQGGVGSDNTAIMSFKPVVDIISRAPKGFVIAYGRGHLIVYII